MKNASKILKGFLLCASVFALSACGPKQGEPGPQGEIGPQGQAGVSITNVTLSGSQGNVDIYTIQYSNGETSIFKVTNGIDGQNGKPGIEGIPGKDGHTPVVKIGENGTWVIDDVDTNIKAQGPKGDKGDKGEQGLPGIDGVSITKIELTKTEGNIDIYTIYYSDGNTSNFKVTNGTNGVDGAQGIQGEPGKDGHTPIITIGSNGNWFIDGKDTNFRAKGDKGDKGDQGIQGEQGVPGKPGVSITKVELTKTEGNTDIYTIYYSDDTTSTFRITNGKDGAQGVQGQPGADGHTPTITIGENGNWFVDNADTGIHAQGLKGDKGETGAQGEKGEQGEQGIPGKDGISVSKIELSKTEGNVDIYTIYYSDGTTTNFKVTNGVDGAQGVQGETGKNGHSPVVAIGSNGHWFIDGTDTGVIVRGPKGDKGDQGTPGVSVTKIEKTATHNNIDTYTIYYSDGKTSTFTVTNGKNGIDGINGTSSKVTIGENGNWFIDGVDSKIKAQGPKGDKGDQGDKGDKGETGNSIVSITKISTLENVDTYEIVFSDGSSTTFDVTNGKDGINGIKGEPGKDGHTPVITIGSNGNWFIDGEDSSIRAQGPKGDKGDQGDQGPQGIQGTSITDIQKTQTQGNIDTYTIYYSDGSSTTFTVTNGVDGVDGIKGEPGKDGHTPVITIGTNGNWYIDGVNTGKTAQGRVGPQGPQGEKGDQGTSIVSIKKESSLDNVDTYSINYSDGHKDTFTVTNGKDGIDGIKGDTGNDGHTPQVTIGENGNWYVDGVDTLQAAQGDTGLSAYEIYKHYHPEYEGTEQQWIEDVSTGKFGKVNITFDTTGGTTIDPITVKRGSYVTVLNPKRNGFIFDGWLLNGSKIDINTFVFLADSHLTATWKQDELNCTLNPNGGEVAYNSCTIKYYSQYNLPIPNKEYFTFDGWYLNGEKIENSGLWTYATEDFTLEARYFKTEINIKTSEGTTKVTRGEHFKLPVPSASTFMGYYYRDTKITDKLGNSLDICRFSGDITLTAKSGNEIKTIYDFANLANSASTKGDYYLSADLDFTGFELPPIEDFSGTFDGQGHTISNLVTVKGSGMYGGIFGTIDEETAIKNLNIVNYEQNGNWTSSGGLIGKIYSVLKAPNADYHSCTYTRTDFDISNINISNSFNSNILKNDTSCLIGDTYTVSDTDVYDRNHYNLAYASIYINNISINNSGKAFTDMKEYSYFIGNMYNASVYENYYTDYGGCDNIFNIKDIVLNNEQKFNNNVSGLISKYTDETNDKAGNNNYSLLSDLIFSNIKSNLKGLKNFSLGTDASTVFKNRLKVSNAEFTGSCETLWNGVSVLTDSTNYGTTKNWNALKSYRCVDITLPDTYKNGEIFYSSVVVTATLDGKYLYYDQTGNKGYLGSSTLINKDFFAQMLHFDETIWDLSNINIAARQYPHIK